MNILEQIVAERREDAAARQREVTPGALERAAARRTHHSLAARLRARSGTVVVAEMKKASPSAGVLRERYVPSDLAREYAAAGAAGISVLTEPRHFQGDGRHLEEVRAAVDLPILRKDFLCDTYQVLEAAAWGADVVLLIVTALAPGVLRSLYARARELGLEVLAEAHTADELDRALELDEAIVGVNSRDLTTLQTDLAVARGLAERIPPGRLCLAESGIRTRSDIETLEAAGYDGFLIGETLLRRADPGQALRELCGHGG